jgi:hypothetical protein
MYHALHFANAAFSWAYLIFVDRERNLGGNKRCSECQSLDTSVEPITSDLPGQPCQPLPVGTAKLSIPSEGRHKVDERI